MKPITVIDFKGNASTSPDCLPVLMGMFATGAYGEWREQVVRDTPEGKKVITPIYLKGELVATIMVG